jgi:hypothetical protein
MTVRVRGIYATALTARLEDVVQASGPIRERFDADLPPAPAAARVETTSDRQGVGVHGDPGRVATVADSLTAVGIDALAWPAALPAGAVYAGEVTDTLGSGAVVDVGADQGFLPYSATSRRIEDGDRLRLQVREPAPPWADRRPVLDTDVRVERGLLTLHRGGTTDHTGTPALADVLPSDPPDGWAADWAPLADDADLDHLGDALSAVTDVAEAVEDALDGAAPPDDHAPAPYWTGEATQWVWFGRESRFALDEIRRGVTETMPGHHRVKAGTDAASAAVDFVEAVCPGPGDVDGDESGFPFDAVTRQFGPTEGDSVAIGHGKPEGRRIELGTAEVVERDPDGGLTLGREMTPGGTYDGLGVERQAGDVAVTEITEGRWWYPTVYRSDEGDRRGTYVNVCTPVEVFPTEVRYVDLHVDVLRHADGSVERVDDDELDAAVAAGHVPEALAERAREVAGAVENALR